MKYIKVIYTIIIGICISTMLSLPGKAQNFEGVIHYEFADATQSGMGSIPYMVKGDNVRMQFGEGEDKGAMIMRTGESKMLFIIDKMDSYMELDMDKWSEDNTHESKWDESEMVQTDKSKTIAGYTCNIWKVTSEGGDTLTLCMAEGLGTFMSPGNPMAQQNAPAWAKEIVADGYMPLEVIEESANGNTTVQMKATKIEEKSLSDSLFEVPNGYKDMSSMMQQMMKQQNK